MAVEGNGIYQKKISIVDSGPGPIETRVQGLAPISGICRCETRRTDCIKPSIDFEGLLEENGSESQACINSCLHEAYPACSNNLKFHVAPRGQTHAVSMVRGFTTIFPRSRGYSRRVKRTYTRHSGYCCRPRMDRVITQSHLVVDQMQGTVHFTCIGMPCISPKSTLLTAFISGKRTITSIPDDVRDTWTTIVYP